MIPKIESGKWYMGLDSVIILADTGFGGDESCMAIGYKYKSDDELRSHFKVQIDDYDLNFSGDEDEEGTIVRSSLLVNIPASLFLSMVETVDVFPHRLHNTEVKTHRYLGEKWGNNSNTHFGIINEFSHSKSAWRSKMWIDFTQCYIRSADAEVSFICDTIDFFSAIEPIYVVKNYELRDD